MLKCHRTFGLLSPVILAIYGCQMPGAESGSGAGDTQGSQTTGGTDGGDGSQSSGGSDQNGSGGSGEVLAANAGADQSVQAGETATLSGSASQGTPPYTFLWQQLSGPATTLQNAGEPTATAVTATSGTAVFRLTVADSAGASATDDVSVVVRFFPEGVIAVNVANGAPGDGASWTAAYNELSAALDAAAASNGGINEIWVAKGTYRHPIAQNMSFQLHSGLAVYGGFAGIERTTLDRDDRNAAANETILTGDIKGDDLYDADANGQAAFKNLSENSPHVVTGDNVDATAILDGFTIKGGNTSQNGAGILLTSAGAIIRNCTITTNKAAKGAGLYSQGGSPRIAACIFLFNTAVNGAGVFFDGGSPTLIGSFLDGNQASNDGGGVFSQNATLSVSSTTLQYSRAARGGGMRIASGTVQVTASDFSENKANSGGGLENASKNLHLEGCSFKFNHANGDAFVSPSSDGGAILNSADGLTVSRCYFSQNTSAAVGGAIRASGAGLLLTNSIIVRNECKVAAGGISFDGTATLINCTIADNVGVGILGENLTLNNSIVWGNDGGVPPGPDVYDNEIIISSGVASFGRNDIRGQPVNPQGGINTDPLFSDQNSYQLKRTSPCIDAGSNDLLSPDLTTDFGGGPRIKGATSVDMGAWEF